MGVKPRNGPVHFVAYDGNGNVVGLVDGSTGLISASYEYGPFGEPIRVTGPMGKANPFRFSTKYTDATSGLIYYGYRYYNPETGRWLNRDPLGELGGLNLYAFVGNSPVDSIDVLGLAVGDSWDPRTSWCKARGVAEGLWGQASGLYNVVRHPQQTMDNIRYALYHYDETAAALRDAIKEAVKQYMDSKSGCTDPCIALKMEGQLASELASAALGAGAASKLATLAKVKFLAKTGKKLETVTEGAKTTARGGESAAAAAGRKAHRELAEKVLKKPG